MRYLQRLLFQLPCAAALFALLLATGDSHALVDMNNASYSNTWRDIAPIKEGGEVPLGDSRSLFWLGIERAYKSRTIYEGYFGFGWCSPLETKLEYLVDGSIQLTECGDGMSRLFIPSILRKDEVRKLVHEYIQNARTQFAIFRAVEEVVGGFDSAQLSEVENNFISTHDLAKKIFGFQKMPSEGDRFFGKEGRTLRIIRNQVIENDSKSSLTRVFDLRGRLVGMRQIDRSLIISYKDDLPVRVADNNGDWLDIQYGADSLIKNIIRHSDGKKSTYEHDARGDLVHHINAWHGEYTYIYDKLHNLVKALWPDGSFIRIDYDTQKDWAIAFRDRDACIEDYSYSLQTQFHYSALVTRKCPKKPSSSSSYEFWHEANDEGNVRMTRLKLLNSKGLKDIRYNPAGYPTDIVTDTGTTYYEYFPNNLVKRRTFRNLRWNFVYGTGNKVLYITAEEFDANGKLVSEEVLAADPWADMWTEKKGLDMPEAARGPLSVLLSGDERPGQLSELRASGKYENAVSLLNDWDREAKRRPNASLYRIMVAQSATTLAVALADTPDAALSIRLNHLVLGIAGEVPDVSIAQSVTRAAKVQQRAGKVESAIATIKAGLSILDGRHPKAESDWAERTSLLRLLASMYLERNYPAKALAALELARATNPTPEYADLDIARIYMDAGLYRESQRLYGRNKDTLHAAFGFDDNLYVRTSLANQIYSDLQQLALSLGQTNNALIINEERLARAKRTRIPDQYILTRLLAERGTILISADRYEEALRTSNEAMSLASRYVPSNPEEMAFVMAQRALIEARLGDPIEAERLTAKAIAVDGTNTVWSSNQAAFLSDTGRFREADVLFKQTRKRMLERLPLNHPSLAALAVSNADALQKQGKFALALRLLEPAVKILRASYGIGHWRTARALNIRTELLLKSQDFRSSKVAALDGLQSAVQSNSLEQRWRANHFMSRVLAGTGQSEAAIFFGKRAINEIQEMRSTLLGLDAKVQFRYGKIKSPVYQDLAGLLVDVGRLPEAQQVLTMLKENELQEFTRRAAIEDSRLTRAELTDEQAGWSREVEAATLEIGALGGELARLDSLRRLGVLDDGGRAQAESLRLKVDMVQATFLRTIQRISLEANATKRVHAAEVQERVLRARTGLRTLMSTLSMKGHSRAICLQYLITEKKLYILVTTPEVQFVRTVAVTEARVNSSVAAFTGMLLDPRTNPVLSARALYRLLFDPVRADLDRLRADTLMVSLMGTLRYVPFAALHDGKDYLVHRFSIAVVTDAAITQGLDVPKFDWNIAGLGVASQVSQEFEPLPAVRDELKNIVRSTIGGKGILPGQAYLDEDFTAARYRTTVLEQPSVIHIASHFKFAANSDVRSFLLLGDGTRLSLHEMMREAYRFSGLELLALSACETGRSGETDSGGREVESLATLAQNQGASAVLATLWSVADRSTGLLMEKFYKIRQSKPGMSKAESLRQAQLFIINESDQPINSRPPYSHPYFWAPFILFGNWL